MFVSLQEVVVVVDSYPLLSGVNLDIDEPSLTVLAGGNGAGKTSLLRLLGGLETMTSGHGEVLGIDLGAGDRRQLRRRVGWLGHEGSFYDELTVLENLTFAARSLGRPIDEILPALERVGISEKSSTLTGRLSAGQRRRFGLAWLIVRRPSLWLLDEPYASLDSQGRVFLDHLLCDVVAAGAAVVMSSHDPLGVEAPPNVSVIMSGGRIVGVAK